MARSARALARLALLTLAVVCLPSAVAQPAPLPTDAALDSVLNALARPAAPARTLPQVPPPETGAAQPEASPPQSDSAADSLLGELAALRAAVAGLAARNDSLATALASRPMRVDTVVLDDTSAVNVAQETVERVGEATTRAVQNFGPNVGRIVAPRSRLRPSVDKGAGPLAFLLERENIP